MAVRLTIRDMQEIASYNNGKCLSKEYINKHTVLTWMCAKGHTWDNAYTIVQQGGWCRQCEKNDSWLENLKELAKKKGGKCLSENYIGSLAKYKFQCSEGHTWMTTPVVITRGSWCPNCNVQKQKLSITEFQEIARQRGGKLLSKKYINIGIHLKWKCEKGHVWMATPNAIKQGGHWCPTCQGRNATIEEFQEIAKSRRGELLSKKYVSSETKLKWKCEKGHTWTAMPYNVKMGSWCPECRYENFKLSIDELDAVAKKRGGKLLSKKYEYHNVHLKWECAKGHNWMATAHRINQGGWCPTCNINDQKLSIGEFQKNANRKGGKLLSKKYVNINTHLKWQCANGHTWLATPAGIKKGAWCRQCSTEKRRLPIEDFMKIAKKHGGKLISKTYKNSITPMKFQCKRGHTWETKPVYVKQGSWCPICARNRMK